MSLILADPLRPSADEDPPAPVRPRRRWELWRSPDDQPWWARPVLLAVAAVAAALYAWNITSGGLAPFYSVAVKSMSVSWKAFFYGAFDPAATVTIDKLAGSFLPQALSARIFGFSVWSLALPQVIEGVIAVLVMYRVVRRWAGVAGGLLGAAIFALTPIAASMFGHSMEDGALTLCLVLAADAYQRAVAEARLRSLLLAGVWVGLGFQAKMLQAWMVLPALAIGYLVAAPIPLRRRLAHIAAAGVVLLAVSLSWIALYTFTPAADRPYVDGSTNNSAIAMVFGYNGVERFGISFPGAVTSGPGVLASAGGGTGPVAEPVTEAAPVSGPANAGAANPTAPNPAPSGAGNASPGERVAQPGGFAGGGGGFIGGGARGGAGTRTGRGGIDLPGITRGGAGAVGGGGGFTASATTTLSGAEQDLYTYVSAHRGGASYLFAVASWATASPYIIATGQEVLPMGGFSGSVPSPTLAFVQRLVSTGQLKFFLVSGTGGGTGLGGAGFGGAGFGGGRGSTAETINTWVTSTCTAGPASAYSASSTTATAGAATLCSCPTAV